MKPLTSRNSPVTGLPSTNHCAEMAPLPNFGAPSVTTRALPSRSTPAPNTVPAEASGWGPHMTLKTAAGGPTNISATCCVGPEKVVE